MTAKDFDFENRMLTVNKSYQRLGREDVITSPKTRKSNRLIKMPDFLCEEMEDFIRMYYSCGEEERLFPVTKHYLKHEMERGCRQTDGKEIRIHDLLLAEQAGLQTVEEIAERADETEADFALVSDQLKETERRLRQAKDLRKHIRNYGRTREIYQAYRKAKNKDSFYEEHRADIMIHEAAKKEFDESGLKSLPSVRTLNTQIEELSAQQKIQYETYCTARTEMRKWQAVKQNIASMLGDAETEKHQGLDR